MQAGPLIFPGVNAHQAHVPQVRRIGHRELQDSPSNYLD
jgi:hypothetical protein